MKAFTHFLNELNEGTGASALGDQTASYEGWLRVAKGGWAPSAVSVGGGPLTSGVDAL